ncbi:glucose-6-phosphate isomerase [Staphylococcus warneri VCU121]|nr:glucose-6-phosphate isomerase [Staphylococcus warneri SG1]EGG95751.1 glucose-6-phosphate isomerase [Staphylococcus warneri VCU121]KEK50780.1 glucose-6-phosphate isomerase [Staphylococcus warneri Lyso 1 2011]KEK58773.1 glucose-6-phosphate isomerase [Staphylococcus warneri Lyso 2 2011]
MLVVIGIRGSYLGARAAIEMLTSSCRTSTEYLEIVFVGNHLSSTYTKELVDNLADKDFSVNVISKSGTTTEPAVAFRLLKQLDEETFSYVVYFFELACAMSGDQLGVPFNQPGVEIYKQNMFALLGEIGFEDKKKD